MQKFLPNKRYTPATVFIYLHCCTLGGATLGMLYLLIGGLRH